MRGGGGSAKVGTMSQLLLFLFIEGFPKDDQREFKLFRSSNGLKFEKILKKFKDGDGSLTISMEPNMNFTSSNKQVASSSANQTSPYCGDQSALDQRCAQSVQANRRDRPGDEICVSQWERYTTRDGPETAE